MLTYSCVQPNVQYTNVLACNPVQRASANTQMHVTHMHEIMQTLQRAQKQCCQCKNMQMQMQAISPAQKHANASMHILGNYMLARTAQTLAQIALVRTVHHTHIHTHSVKTLAHTQLAKLVWGKNCDRCTRTCRCAS